MTLYLWKSSCVRLMLFPDIPDKRATGEIILTVTASEESSQIYLSIWADCSDAAASSVGRSQEDSAQFSAVNDRRYFTATTTSICHRHCSARHPLTKSPAIYLSTLSSAAYTRSGRVLLTDNYGPEIWKVLQGGLGLLLSSSLLFEYLTEYLIQYSGIRIQLRYAVSQLTYYQTGYRWRYSPHDGW